MGTDERERLTSLPSEDPNMPLSTTELNRLADYIVVDAMTARAHDGDPDANGTNNRIGTAEGDLSAASWSGAAGGDVTYNDDVEIGVLDAANSQDVTWFSLWRGNAFVHREQMSATVAVVAGGTFTINTGTIVLNGSTS